MLKRIEKCGDFHAMIREKFCIQPGAGLGLVQVNADKASCNASFPYTVYLVRSLQEYLESYSVDFRPNHVGNALPTVATSGPSIKRRHSLSTPADVRFSTGRLNRLSRFHLWVDRALLFKKGVVRKIAVLEVADNVFSNILHSRIPLHKFWGRRTAGNLSQIVHRPRS